MHVQNVADLGFDLGGRKVCQHGGGGRKALKVLTVKLEINFSAFLCHIYNLD